MRRGRPCVKRAGPHSRVGVEGGHGYTEAPRAPGCGGVRIGAPTSSSIEGGAHVPDVERATRVHRDGHDVEAAADAVEPAPLEIVLGQSREPALLVPGDG